MTERRATTGVTAGGAALPPRPGIGPRAAAPPLLLAGLALLLGACAAAAPVEGVPARDDRVSRVYEGLSREAAWERTLTALRASDLRIASADEGQGVITAVAEFEDASGWAACPRPRVVQENDLSRQIRRAEPLSRRLELTTSVREAPPGGAAEVTLDPDFSVRLRNSFTNQVFTEPCRSTGVLERRIVEALRA